MKLSLIILSIASFSPLANSTYLDCTIKSDKGETTEFSVKLNESASKITHTYKGGNTQNTEGFFTANSIKYKDFTNLGSIHFTRQYEIDRTTLEITSASTIEPADKSLGIEPTHSLSSGMCDIVEVKKRKI